MQINTFPITLLDSFMISPKVKHFIFRCELSPAFNFQPGQFITIHFNHKGATLRRSYSIANSPIQDNQIEFAAGYFEGGPGTKLLYDLKPGDKISVNGPFGRLILKDKAPKRFIMVATSTGVTPYRSMIKELSHRIDQDHNLQVVILQGVQKREEILYADEFKAFSNQYSQVTFRPCLSKEKAQDLKEGEHSGYVQSVLPELNLNHEQDLVYLCGNPGMIDEAFNYLKDQGFAIQQIIREKYISN